MAQAIPDKGRRTKDEKTMVVPSSFVRFARLPLTGFRPIATVVALEVPDVA
jgi:hypothetical protein